VNNHFADLRLNSGNGGKEEAFWPSFTDIMTVIVMIFLMVMLVLLLKNMDLVQRLQATLEAERTANEQVASTSSLNRDLQQQLDMLRMQLINMGEERDRLTGELGDSRKLLQESETTRLQSEAALQQTRDALSREQEGNSRLSAQLTQSQQDLSSLDEKNRQHQERIRTLEQEKQRNAQNLAALQNNFASLKVKYDKLVRPARSASGKYVVKVRILREQGELHRFLQSPGQKQFVEMNEPDMRSALDALHAKHPDDMYVRIIFPDKSGLSYAEAWNMTESLLKRYDYYYRETPLDSSKPR